MPRVAVIPLNDHSFTIYQRGHGSGTVGDTSFLVYYTWTYQGQVIPSFVADEKGGGKLNEYPAAVRTDNGNVYRDVVVAQGTDNNIWEWAGYGFDWHPFPNGALKSAPTICNEKVGNGYYLHVFAVALNGQLAHSFKASDGQWSNWIGSFDGSESIPDLPGGILKSPFVTCPLDGGRLDIVALGNDKAVWHLWYDRSQNTWAPQWYSLGGTGTDEPTACWSDPGTLHVFVRGTDSETWHKYFDWSDNGLGSWHNPANYQDSEGWANDPGAQNQKLSNTPTPVCTTPGIIDLFADGAGRPVYHTRWNGSGWDNWKEIRISNKIY